MQSMKILWRSTLVIVAVLSAYTVEIEQVSAERAPSRTGFTETEQRGAIQRNTEAHRELFDPSNPENPIPGKSYRDLTAEDFQRLPREGDIVIVSALLAYSKEYYDLADSIKPNAMTRDHFLHVLLREANRRRILLSQVLNSTGHVPTSVANQNVTISRPLDVRSRPSRWCNFGCGRGPSSGGFGGDV